MRSARFPKTSKGTFDAHVDVMPLDIGAGIQVFPFLISQNSFLIAVSFPLCLCKPCSLGIIGGSLRTINFSVSFSSFVCIASFVIVVVVVVFFFFLVLLDERFWVIRF